MQAMPKPVMTPGRLKQPLRPTKLSQAAASIKDKLYRILQEPLFIVKRGFLSTKYLN